MLQVEKDNSKQWFFWTVTLDGNDHNGDTAQSLQVWREKWDILMKRIKRDLGKFAYVRIFETHKDGTFHVHMLADAGYDDIVITEETDDRVNYHSPKFNKHLEEVGLGWRHDIRPIITTDYSDNGNARNVSAYVTKYLTKTLQGDVRNVLKSANMSRVRMIQTSLGWANTEHAENDRSWSIGVLQIGEYSSTIKNDIAVVDVDTKQFVSYDDFYDASHYPNKTSDLLDRYNQGED